MMMDAGTRVNKGQEMARGAKGMPEKKAQKKKSNTNE
jgi:hypothetical protein